MQKKTRMRIQSTLAFIAAVWLTPGLLHAQFDFKLWDRDVQVHSFGSQGFMSTNQNNYMSMPTSKGSFAFTDGGANISSQVTDKFRVGAQFYTRNVGEIGNWHPELDWMLASYRFKSWFGVRGGKVKTVLGLLNDVQDNDSLHTFALLPQSMYPIDWRSSTIAHNGGDIFGDVAIKHLGTFSYTGYAGARPQDHQSGYVYAYRTLGIDLQDQSGPQIGGDLRLTTFFGAIIGTSFLNQDIRGTGTILTAGKLLPYKQDEKRDQTMQAYGEYTIKGFKVDVEYRKNLRNVNLYRVPNAPAAANIVDSRSWYVSGTYRVAKHLELGAYRSVYLVDDRKPVDPPAQHEYDTAISGRVDLTSHWYMKVEGHFIDGAAVSPSAARGFYNGSNPTGILPTTNLLVLRTGVSF